MHLTFEINWCPLQAPKSVGVLGRSPSTAPRPLPEGPEPWPGVWKGHGELGQSHKLPTWRRRERKCTVLNSTCLWGWDTRWPELYCSGPWVYPLVNWGRTTEDTPLNSALSLGIKFSPLFLPSRESPCSGQDWPVCPCLGFSEQVLLDLNPCLPMWLLSVITCIIFQVAQNLGGEEGAVLCEGVPLETPTAWVSVALGASLNSWPLASYYGM